MLLLSTLVFAMIWGVKGQCSLEEQPKVDNLCSATVLCAGTTELLKNAVQNNWSCIRYVDTDYYRQMYYRYATNYNLYVFVSDVDINISEDYLIGITDDLKSKIITLIVKGGNLVSLGITLTGFDKLTEFSLTFNEIETLNLNQLSGDSIKIVNVSHNCISLIEEDKVGTGPSFITTLDLSYNAIESIPNNCFSKFSHLRYLNLSSNKITQLDILTFEGIIQLEALQLSFNNISEIGQNFARFMKLKDLNLDFNQLTSLADLNFRNLISLEKLNLSSNLIQYIEDQTLAKLTNLEQLDLSHNKLHGISEPLFQNSAKLNKLSLSHNIIENIERGAFRSTNISNFDIRYNNISGSINNDTFIGISVERLDLSNGSVKQLGNKAFSALCHDLMFLNLSSNLIDDIAKSAFQSLEILSKLDMSYNNLINIDFNTSDLIQLTEYYLHSNQIENVTQKMFRNLTSLVKLDLSHNKIKDIELDSFIELKNLKELNISRNIFVKSLTMNIFRGLDKVETLDLSYTRSMSCLDQSFSGMVSLAYLNLSHSQLKMIEYETFKETGYIKIIDLSYNLLDSFYVNTLSISQLSELYLNHNILKNITSVTFKNLTFLKKLSLAYNNILYIDSSGLQKLSHLRYLDLFSNYNLHIKGDVFNNLVLSQVSLQNVPQQFSFKNSLNISVTTLILSNCEIEDVNSVFIFKIRNIFKLDLSTNNIKTLNKGSFYNMDALNWLDISFNKISHIQPGTFLTNKIINTLNLFGNNLQSLQFGVLDGLRNLRVLNLSNNEIDIFGSNLVHNAPNLNKLFLENNNLESMDLRALSKTSVKLVTIGGNSISCDALIDWNKENNTNLNVTAGRLDFDSENIHGISCKSRSSSRRITPYKNTDINVTGEVIEIKKIFGQLYSYLKISLNETFTKIINDMENVPHYNNSNKLFNDQLSHILNENKILSDNVANNMKLMILLLERNNNLTELSSVHKELLLQIPISNKTIERHENFTKYFVSKLYDAESLEVKLDKSVLSDIKMLLYFIAMCLAIVILFFVVAITHKYIRQKSHRVRRNQTYDSRQSVRNSLQME